ncbi:hypothetical protein EMCRGX_G008481 [Ephydatia muelleri]
MSDQRDAEQPSLSSSDAMSLSRFVELYSNALPQMVRVVSGFGPPSVREPGCDCLSIVEANCSQVVAAETADGEAFLLPLNTTTKLSLIYNPTGDPREAVQGFVFKTVADLKVISPRPRLVCTKNSWIDPDHDDDDEPLLEANEILVLMEDETSAEGLSGLRVFSMNTRTTKFLPDHCSPVFSTAASRLSLHLPDILAYVSRPFPCEACIVRQREQQSCNRCYPANVVALTALTTSTVLRCLELTRRGGGASLVSTYYVPGDLPGVEVVVEETSGGQTCGSVFPAKDAFTGELSCQSDKDPSSAPSASNPSALAEQSTGRLTGDDVKVPVAPCGRDEDGSRTSLVAESNHLYETIADIPARCGLSRSLERSHTGSSNGSLKQLCHQNMSANSLERNNRSFDGDTPLTRSSSASPHHGSSCSPIPMEVGSDHLVSNARRPTRRCSTKEQGRRPSAVDCPSKLAYNGQLNAVTGQINHSFQWGPLPEVSPHGYQVWSTVGSILTDTALQQITTHAGVRVTNTPQLQRSPIPLSCTGHQNPSVAQVTNTPQLHGHQTPQLHRSPIPLSCTGHQYPSVAQVTNTPQLHKSPKPPQLHRSPIPLSCTGHQNPSVAQVTNTPQLHRPSVAQVTKTPQLHRSPIPLSCTGHQNPSVAQVTNTPQLHRSPNPSVAQALSCTGHQYPSVAQVTKPLSCTGPQLHRSPIPLSCTGHQNPSVAQVTNTPQLHRPSVAQVTKTPQLHRSPIPLSCTGHQNPSVAQVTNTPQLHRSPNPSVAQALSCTGHQYPSVAQVTKPLSCTGPQLHRSPIPLSCTGHQTPQLHRPSVAQVTNTPQLHRSPKPLSCTGHPNP